MKPKNQITIFVVALRDWHSKPVVHLFCIGINDTRNSDIHAATVDVLIPEGIPAKRFTQRNLLGHDQIAPFSCVKGMWLLLNDKDNI